MKLADIKDKEILAGKKDLKVVMEEQTENLEDVVVTGIFTRKKEGFTGSATRVSRDEIKRMTSGNVLKALEMLDPGFRMNASNLAGSNLKCNTGIFKCEDKLAWVITRVMTWSCCVVM